MAKFPSKKVDELLGKNDWQAIKQEIKNWLLNEEKSEAEAKKLLLSVRAYTKLKSEATAGYLKSLDSQVKILKDLKSKKSGVDDSIRDKKIRNKIKDL